MSKLSACWAFLYLSIKLVCAATKIEDNFYMAGVVEVNYENLSNSPMNESNILEYLEIINSNNTDDLDIIVFPEMTLSLTHTFFVPNAADQVVPCDNEIYKGPVSEISCAAKLRAKYIVINLREKSKCPEPNDTRPCAPNGENMFNSNVVFDRNGTVISKYRKFNLFGEGDKNITKEPELATFDTDFGVKFGHFICFDILFDTPALELPKNGIKNIIFTSMWFSELPFLTAVQTQQGWAYSNDVNLIAAGANFPEIGSTGSGIYAGKNGKLVSAMNSKLLTQLYKAKVAKDVKFLERSSEVYKNEVIDMSHLKLKRDGIDAYTTMPLPNKTSILNETVCHADFCCHFAVSYEIGKYIERDYFYKYRLAVYDGDRTFDGLANGDVFSCGVIACTNETLESCGIRFDKEITGKQITNFKSIEIRGEFRSRKTLIIPSSLSSNILPFDVETFDFTEGEEFMKNGQHYKKISYKLKTNQSDLLTFAIYGRSFDIGAGHSRGLSNILISIFIVIFISKLIENY